MHSSGVERQRAHDERDRAVVAGHVVGSPRELDRVLVAGEREDLDVGARAGLEGALGQARCPRRPRPGHRRRSAGPGMGRMASTTSADRAAAVAAPVSPAARRQARPARRGAPARPSLRASTILLRWLGAPLSSAPIGERLASRRGHRPRHRALGRAAGRRAGPTSGSCARRRSTRASRSMVALPGDLHPDVAGGAAPARHRLPVAATRPRRSTPRGSARRSSPPAPRRASRCASSCRRSSALDATRGAGAVPVSGQGARAGPGALAARVRPQARAAGDLRRRHAARAARGAAPSARTSC